MVEWYLRKKIKLSYGITVCNESVELERLILFLLLYKDRQDEIIVLQDSTHKDEWVSDVVARYQGRVTLREEKLNHDFATFKNKLLDVASGDYLFQIDADELPGQQLIRTLKNLLIRLPRHDCFAVPRVNLVKGITPEFIDQWQWETDEKGRINFPDYQFRIFRLNQAIKWRYKVHEELYGFQNCYKLPATDDDSCLIHLKDIDRQKRQNDFYDSF